MSEVVLGPWRLVERTGRLGPWSDEGVATFGGSQVYRGGGSVPLRLRGDWPHIGDPDARGGVLVDCFQGRPGTGAKLFRVTDAEGRHGNHHHKLGEGELMNNSFVAIEPTVRWMVSGEWGQISRLLVFAVPSAADDADVPLGGTLHLDRPVRNVQGAAWVDPLTLLCSTSDPDTDLWPVASQLLQVTLDAPLGAGDTPGRVTCLGALPLQSRCRGAFEVEGMDYDPDTGDLRVVIIPPAPCKHLFVSVYRFRRD